MIVIDIGCAEHGADYSIERLIEEFRPSLLYGFDPAYEGEVDYEHDRCRVIVWKASAWTYSGTVGFTAAGLRGHVDESGPPVACMDLAAYIAALPLGTEIVLKADCEGGEYDLLDHLVATGADRRLKLAIIEWHPEHDPDGSRRAGIEAAIHCELVEWRW